MHSRDLSHVKLHEDINYKDELLLYEQKNNRKGDKR